MMLLAWYEMTTSKDTLDPLGFWSLAGIHGQDWEYLGHTPRGPRCDSCSRTSSSSRRSSKECSLRPRFCAWRYATARID